MKKFTAILLAVVMLFALSASAFAATNSLETDYAIGDGLGVSVDLNIEGMYFDGVDILNTATNGYYPFSFSLIVSNRSKVASVTVSNGGSFHWAYEEDGNGGYVTDEDGNYVESTTTKYGVVVLPTTSASTVTVTGTDGYIYIQKTIPFESGGRFTVAVINRPGGLDLLRITDTCCFAPSRAAHFRVGNLARNSGALDVLLPDGRAAYSDVRFKEITSFKRIAPGAYEFLFAETNQLPAPAYTDIETLDSAFIGANPLPDTAASVYLQVTRGRAYTVYLLQSGQGYNAVSPLVVEDVI